jgi:hypothetical protein
VSTIVTICHRLADIVITLYQYIVRLRPSNCASARCLHTLAQCVHQVHHIGACRLPWSFDLLAPRKSDSDSVIATLAKTIYSPLCQKRK